MTQRKMGKLELGLAGFFILLIFGTLARGEMAFVKSSAPKNTVAFQGTFLQKINGPQDLQLSIYKDREKTELVAQEIYKAVEFDNGGFSVDMDGLGLEVGENYWATASIDGGLVSEMQIEILPEQRALAGNGENVTTGRYDIGGNYTDYVVRVTNTSAVGAGIIARANGGTAISAESTGTAISATGGVEITGDLNVSGITTVDLPADSVGSAEIIDGAITEVDISPAASINADKLDDKDSTEFAALDAEGNMQINGNFGVGITSTAARVTLVQTQDYAAGLRLQAQNQRAHLHIRPSKGKNGEISFTEDGEADRWAIGTKGGDDQFYFSSGLTFLESAIPRMVIDADKGYVGIGTTIPAGKLDVTQTEEETLGLRVHGDNAGAHLHIRPSRGKKGEISFTEDGVFDRWVIGIKPDDSNLYFSSGTTSLYTATPRLAINGSTGNIGVGTTAALGTLTLAHDGDNPHDRPTNSYAGGLWLENATSGKVLLRADHSMGSLYDGDFVVLNQVYNGAQYAWIENFRIRSDGNIGIRTASPTAPLTINSIYAREMIKLFSGPSTQWNLGIRNNNGDAFEIGEGLVNSAHLMIAKSSGNVGIGKNPDYKLDVNGYIQGSALCINGDCRSSWPSGIGGGGNGNYLAKFSGSNTIGDSSIYDNGNVGIGLTAPPSKLSVYVPGIPNVSDMAFSIAAGNPAGEYHLDIKPLIGNGVVDYQFVAVNEGDSAIPVMTLRQNGDVDIARNVRAANIQAHYQDLAEWAPSMEQLIPGTVVVIDEVNDNHVVACKQAYDSKVAGVVSYQPGLLLGEGGEGRYMIAHTGRVKVKVDAGYGAITKGDLLVTSPVEGVAMKSQPLDLNGRPIHQPGTILGKALESLSKGQGEILVLLSLQ